MKMGINKIGNIFVSYVVIKNYVEIHSHLDTVEHKHAAMDDARYAGVDALIKKGASMEEFLKMIKEKHSVRSCDNE